MIGTGRQTAGAGTVGAGPGRFNATLSLLVILMLAPAVSAVAQPAAEPPRILLVTAHPDDDALFSGTVYKVTHGLGGLVDLAVVTNGEGGYKYSTLAEPIYGLKLSDEAVGRAHLPRILKQELMAGGAIVGIHDYFFLDQLDSAYTLDMAKIFDGEWDVDFVRRRLEELMRKGLYHFVFVLLPTLETHAGHRASAILALEAANRLPADQRPIVLGGTARVEGRPDAPAFTGLADHPLTKIRPDSPVFEFDRTQKFGFDNRLDYNIFANWVIAEHKSQGTMQLLMNLLARERYLYFDLNGKAGLATTRAFFDRVAAAPIHAP